MAKKRTRKKLQWIYHAMHACEKAGTYGRTCGLDEGHRGKHFDSAHPGLGRWAREPSGAKRALRSRRAKAGWARRKRGGSHRHRVSKKRRTHR